MTPEQAQRELDKLKKSLLKWIKVRSALVKVAKGELPGDKETVTESLSKYLPEEVALGNKLRELLSQVYPDKRFTNDPVDLAEEVLGEEADGYQAQAGIGPWLIVGGTLVILFLVKNLADAAADKREMEACKQGIKEYCPFPWKKILLIGGLVVGGYLVWTKTDFKQWVSGMFDNKQLKGRQEDDEDA